jgi:DNA ligase-1
VLALPCKSLICEGEAIAYNPNTGNFVPFQETVKRKRKHNIEETAQDLPLRVYLFDLLYLNGHLLLDKHLSTRRTELKSLINDSQQSAIVLIEEVAITTAQELEAYFYKQLGDGLEGVVVKRPDTSYQPGKRNFNWIKLKRQESGELSDTLDCVILGYYFGEGKRASFGIGAFLVGLYNPAKDMYQTVAKIGTGLADAQWRQLRHDLDALAVAHKPVLVSCDPLLYPDVWVNPERVVMVRADEITRSPAHTAGKEAHEYGYALRFPRYMGDRPDKSAQESTTVAELKTLFSQQKVIVNQ